MEIDATESDFVNWISEVLRVDGQENEDSYVFDLSEIGVEKGLALHKNVLTETLEYLRNMEEVEDTVILGPRYYEGLVREESTFPRFRIRLRDAALSIEDKDSGIQYTLSSPSNEYLLFLLYKVSSITSPRALIGPMPTRRIRVRSGEEEINDVFDLLRRGIPMLLTLRLETDRNRTSTELAKFSNAFLFQLSYNVDVALVPQRHLEELVRTGRITRVRRVPLNELDPPRRHYIPNLIYYYQLAVGADNPFLEYISYYHVAEHFFESVFNDDLITRIKDKITQPDFSYKSKKDIGGLIKDISRSLQIRNERITFSEQEALRLTIDNYVDLGDIKEKLNEYDDSLVDYYKNNKVGFSGGDEVDLENQNESIIGEKLSSRIYKTRNAIVHSKESERVRYTPFRDDRILVKEIPLLRFIAEQIIIESSSVVT